MDEQRRSSRSNASKSTSCSKSRSNISNATGDFTRPIQAKIHAWNQFKCFACDSQNIDTAHIVEKANTSVSIVPISSLK